MIRSFTYWIPAACLAAGIHVNGQETLPPLGQNGAPQTLDETWGGYDPENEPMEVETFKEWEEEGVVIRAMRYYIGTFKGKKAWMAGLYAYPKGGKNLPAILQSHGGGGSASSKQCIDFGRRGYAIFSLSWRVEPRYLENYDLPPEAQTYWGGVTADQVAAARGVRPSGELNLDPVPSGRNEGYFLRTLAARRGITFLAQQPEVDPDRIGMTGHSMGGTLTHQTTAMEPVRLKASVPSDGPPIEHLHKTPQNTPRREEDKLVFDLARRTAMPALYTEKIAVPMLFLNSVNDFHGHAEDVEWIIDNMPEKDYNLARTPHANHWHNAAASAAKFLWFETHLKGTFDYPRLPAIELNLETQNGIPELSVIPDPNSRPAVESVDVYYTRDGDNDFYQGYQSRIWHYAKPSKKGTRYQVDIPVSGREAPLWVYADVHYRLPEDNDYYQFPEATETLLCSTRMAMVSCQELQAAGVNFAPVEPTLVVDDFGENWEKEWMSRRAGVDFASYKLLAPDLQIPERAKLVFQVESEGKTTGRIAIGDYSTKIDLKPGANEVELLPYQFKNNKTKTSILDWRKILKDRPPIKLSINASSPWDPKRLTFVEMSPEAFNVNRPDRLAKAKPIDGKLPLTFELADQVVTSSLPSSIVFTATRGKKTADYDTGVMIRSESEITYFLNGNFTRFQAIGAPYWQASVTYEVWVDGERVFASERITGRSRPTSIDIDITGKQELKLVVTDAGNGTGGDVAMWSNARLIQ